MIEESSEVEEMSDSNNNNYDNSDNTRKASISFSGDVQVFGEQDQHSGSDGSTSSTNSQEFRKTIDDELDSNTTTGDPNNGYIDRASSKVIRENDTGYFIPSHHPNDNNGNKRKVSSPSRTPLGTYAPVRKPLGVGKSSLKKPNSSSTKVQSAEERKQESQVKYEAQQDAYVKKLTQDMWHDYYDRQQPQYYHYNIDDLRLDSDDENFDDYGEAFGLGGVGTSFDDEYLDIGSNFPFLEIQFSLDDANKTDEQLKERLEWQAMLSSVLTGEVVRSEKNRLREQPEFGTLMHDDDWWIAIRAKVCGRTIEEQRRVVDFARTKIDDVFKEFWSFKIQYGSGASLDSTVEQVEHILARVEKIESLWRNLASMRQECRQYGDEAFQQRLEALIAWLNITGAITQEFELLRSWTQNDEIDPTMRPGGAEDDRPSLVETMLKQDDLEGVFVNRLQKTMGPLIQKARDATVEYSEIYVELGLPLFHDRLAYLMQFPVKMIQEFIRLRLVYAKRLVNPTTLIIDQMIRDLGRYLKLAVSTIRRNEEYAAPIFDKGWVFANYKDISFNESVLDCLDTYLGLLQNKMLRDSRLTSQMYLTFKESDHLESQYAFLKDVGMTIKGADLLVAEAFTALESKLLGKLYAYWDKQIKGPPVWTPVEAERWFSTTTVNARSFQRKLLRFSRYVLYLYI